MDNITENNLIALLEECFVNGNTGPIALWMWFLQERVLISQTLGMAKIDLISEYEDKEPES